jgi:hypothetical protein
MSGRPSFLRDCKLAHFSVYVEAEVGDFCAWG